MRKATRSGTSLLAPFMTVDFVPAADGSPERARVTLDPQYLVPDGMAQVNVDQGVVTATWRSVAELANSTAVQLRGQFRRSNLRQRLPRRGPMMLR